MQGSEATGSADLKGLRVFIVEDESLVAMQLEDILSDLGCEIVGMAMRVRRALDMLSQGEPADVAVLDVNIGGETVYPVAESLRERGVRIVFATGYGRNGVVPEWQSWPVLQKPYTEGQVAASLCEVMAGDRLS